jgi:hypothetical protein
VNDMKGEKIFSISIILALLIASLITLGVNIEKANAQNNNDALIAEWKFNEGSANTIQDSSGNNYNGELHGGTWIGSQGNYALDFNGQSNYISVPSLPISNTESLTVSAWINSDFSKTGYIFYHGDTGEFLLHNGERFSDGPVAGRYPNKVSFSVKIDGSTWFDVYSGELQPNVWHQIVGIWIKNETLQIYVDGSLAGENSNIASGNLLNDGSYWLPSIGVYNRGAESNTYYKGMLDDVSVYGSALSSADISALYSNSPVPPTPTPQPTATPAPTITPSRNPAPTLNITCKSVASQSALNVKIIGFMTFANSGISDQPILISYSVNKGSSWNDLTSVDTANDGSFNAEWHPTVTGNYLVKATFNGNSEYSSATVQANFAVTPYKEESTFSVTSNSTITQLAFNSTSNHLTFTVNGESGTTGYVNAYIPKTLINDVSALKVYLDEKQIDCMTESQSDACYYPSYTTTAHTMLL